MRRTLTIISIVIVLLGIIAAVYFFVFRSSPKVVVTQPSPSLPTTGTSSSTQQTATSSLPQSENPSPAAVTQRLTQISKGPVVTGAQIVTYQAATASSSPETKVFYIERQSGNVYTYQTQSKALTRINNKTIPGIQSATWLSDGSLAFVRYLSGPQSTTINTYALPSTGTGGYFLNQDIADISVASSSILTLASNAGASTAFLSEKNGASTTPLFTTPLTSLRVSFAGTHYLAYTKPSGTLPGYAYLVDAKGTFSRIAGPKLGLVALASPRGNWVLTSYTGADASLHMELVNASTTEAISLPVETIADKCVWTVDESALYCGIPSSPLPQAQYPDDWYQGAVSFTDKIWKINVTGRYAAQVLDFTKESKMDLDATALSVDAAATFLSFVNKRDGSLWVFSL